MPEYRKASYVASFPVNGLAVGFYDPPHNEPDLMWVDVIALSRALFGDGPEHHILRKLKENGSPAGITVVRHGDQLVNIIDHTSAQGFASAIDVINGYNGEDGPAFYAYCRAASKVMYEHRRRAGLSTLFGALDNIGGPYRRKDNDGGNYA